MSNLSITAANVVAGANAIIDYKHNAGASISQGQQVYLDATSLKWKIADDNSATPAARVAQGTALNAASDNQPIAVQTDGDLIIGAALTAGVDYYLSATAGAICPVGDLTTGDYPCRVGMAKTATVLTLDYRSTGAVLA